MAAFGRGCLILSDADLAGRVCVDGVSGLICERASVSVFFVDICTGLDEGVVVIAGESQIGATYKQIYYQYICNVL
jgi:hypothetical protein